MTYRGYVYDTESSLYYLQSRYYNANVGGFINADSLVSTGQGILGNNMFAYCNNSVLVLCDSLGTVARRCFGFELDVFSMPWRDTWAVKNSQHDKDTSLSAPKKRIDITERLNKAMVSHAEELLGFAKLYGGVAAALYFANMVRGGGEWDLKSKNGWNLIPSIPYTYGGRVLAYDDVGNIHYGFVGRVLFPKKILLVAGGAIQVISGTSAWSFANYYFDDPHDYLSISFGSSLWEGGFN